MKLIIATPSPFARKVRVALREKNMDFQEQIDVPWNPEAVAGEFNPLGKIPALILDNGSTVFDSSVIVEYLETLGYEPPLIPKNADQRFRVRQIEVLADGISDALVLIVLEKHRPQELHSGDWIERQQAKIDGGLAALSQQLGDAEYFVGERLTVADIAAGCALGYLDLRLSNYNWRNKAGNLKRFKATIDQRPSFQETFPTSQEISSVR